MEDDRKRSAEPAADPVWNPGPIEYAPGVTLYRTRDRDEYTGLPGDLIAAGLCREDQLPGLPGRGIAACTYWPDGSRKARGSAKPTPGTLQISKKGYQFMCRIYTEPTEQERQYWKQKDAERDAERAEQNAEYLRQSAERDKSPDRDHLRNQDESPSVLAVVSDETLRSFFSDITDEHIDWVVETELRSSDRALRVSREVKDARRKEASSIARIDGVVIFPKRWHHA